LTLQRHSGRAAVGFAPGSIHLKEFVMRMRFWIRHLFNRLVARTIRKAPHRFRPALEVLEDRCVPSTFIVNSTGDTGAGSGLTGDLRYCITKANADGASNTITFDPTVFAKAQTITLSGTQLELSDTSGTQSITGPTAGVTVNGGGLSRVFQVDKLVTASISGLTISGGSSTGSGGGVQNYGSLAMINCTVSGNSASGSGGGIFNQDMLNVASSTINNNTATTKGGGISTIGGSATIKDSVINTNQVNPSATALGGGIDCENSALSLTGCTVNANRVNGVTALGGGIYAVNSTVDIANSVVNGNKANGSVLGEGGGIYSSNSSLTLMKSIVKGNKATTAFNDIFGP
jgi:hypothetical protein